MSIQPKYVISDSHLDPMALRCYREINALQDRYGIYHQLSKEELKSISHYIEKELPKQIAAGNFYLKKEVTGLARTIEHDPLAGKTFIHLKRKNLKELGRGGAKTVTVSIEYGTKPQYVANSIFKAMPSNEKEVNLMTRLKGNSGIINIYSSTRHVSSKNEEVLQLITPLYSHGSLKSFMEKGLKPTFTEKKSLCRDLLNGLSNMHDKGTAHGDIHQGNCLVQNSTSASATSRFEAVLTDFGTSVDLERHPLYEVRDMFAAGCMLYELIHETHRQSQHWDKLNTFAQLPDKLPTGESNALLLGDLGATTACYRSLESAARRRKLTERECLELLAMRLMHPTQGSFVNARQAAESLA